MIRIAISEAAFEALPATRCRWSPMSRASTLLGLTTFGWNRTSSIRLEALRGPDEDYSQVILRIAEQQTLAARRG
jgi:hypothetical protein